MLENIGHIDNRLSRFFILISRQNNEIYQRSVAEKYVQVLSLMMFYHNSTTKVICLRKKVFRTWFNNFSGLGIAKNLMNIMSCHVFFRINDINSDSYMLQFSCAIIFFNFFLLLKNKKVNFKIYQNRFSVKSVVLRYMKNTAFRCVKQKYHKLLKH